ncbi:MAG: universal stress protein [Planctomycetes bacterium]|nr:universal stress protein [Planctomycetota bacterium]
MSQPNNASTQVLARAPEVSLRQLSPLLVWAVVFCDIGTSIYYVPGILYGQIGDAAPLFVFAALFGFVLLAWKYIEICWRNPEGGGVVSVAKAAFNPRWGLIGGLLICVDYFLTSAISSVSGIAYLGSVMPYVDQHKVLIAVLALVILAVLNIVGIRESALISLFMAIGALIVDAVIIGVALVRMGPDEWHTLSSVFEHHRELSGRELLIGFAGSWLAFSGLESISQLSPAMKLPIRNTAGKGMWLVVVTVLTTSPILTLLSIALLPEAIKADSTEQERFISELAGLWGIDTLKYATVATASSLLLFAANTAIIGSYHVFLALADEHFMPDVVNWRNRRFGTPHLAIVVATVLPIGVIFFTGGELEALGELYAFGLLGAFVLSSLGIDLIRWRERERGLKFVLGVLTTLMVVVAWFTNLIAKEKSTVFGAIMVGVGLVIAIGTQQKWFTDWLYDTPLVKRRAHRAIAQSESELESVTGEVFSLAQAVALTKGLYPSHTLLGMRSANDSLLQEAILREKGLGGNTIYALYIEERTGLFVRASDIDSPENSGALRPLLEAAKKAERQGMQLIPIWTVSYNAVEGMVRAAEALGVDAVMVGATQRTAVYHLIRGHVVNGLAKRLPAHIRLVLCG